MHALPIPSSLPSLRIDGVAHRLSALAVPNRDDRLPGGLRWSLELDMAFIVRALPAAPDVRSGRPSLSFERQLYFLLRKLLGQGGRPRFCLATIDRVDVGEKRVRVAGRCAPLFIDALGSRGLTRSCS
jgi:hypothetical protein